MAHTHTITDSDKHFLINPVTREIANESGKLVLVQGDHKSERATFSIDRYVDGHDMSLCNRVQVHYTNVETSSGAEADDVYEADDLKASTGDSQKVVFTWLISGNATQYVGDLIFSITFLCEANDGTIEYSWSTGENKEIKVIARRHNSEAVVAEYSDVLEEWRQSLALAAVTEQYTPEQARAELGAATRITARTTLGSVWTGNAAPYTQSVTVPGILATDTPHISPVYSSNVDTFIEQRDAWSAVGMATAANNSIVFTCFEDKPGTEVPIQIEVVR